MNSDKRNDNADTFLADWLVGKLSDAELMALVSESDFRAFLQLKSGLEQISLAEPDQTYHFAKVKQKLAAAHDHKKTKVFPIYRYAAIAAAILALIGLFQLFIFSNTVATGYGESTAFGLNDGSRVILNAKSEVSFPSLFQYNRLLELDGEAYFNVKKGRNFTVKTKFGKVTVLGTRFNVVAQKGYFEVSCYDGKVCVEANGNKSILLKGDVLRWNGANREVAKHQTNQPDWILGESSFKNTPFYHVVAQFENQYHQKITFPKQLGEVKFTGSFANRDLSAALQSICIPLHLKYIQTANGEITISE